MNEPPRPVWGSSPSLHFFFLSILLTGHSGLFYTSSLSFMNKHFSSFPGRSEEQKGYPLKVWGDTGDHALVKGPATQRITQGGHTRTHSINHYFDIAATRRESLRRSVTQGCWWDFSQCVCVDWLNLSASENSFEEHIPHLLLNIFKQKKRIILAIPCDARALQHSVSVKWVRKRSLLWCLLSLLDKRSSTISRPYAKISLLEALIFIIFLETKFSFTRQQHLQAPGEKHESRSTWNTAS